MPSAELYVKRYFPPDNKAKIDAIVGNIRTAFDIAHALARLDGRQDARRSPRQARGAAGHDRLPRYVARLFRPRRSNPASWSKAIYRGFRVRLARAAARSRPGRSTAAAGPTPAHVVNAFYSPLGNTFVLPAGILQPPFFDPKADPAANYGGIGAVIGHEMSHGFDDQGRQFDGVGRTFNWWTERNRRSLRRTLQRADRPVRPLLPVFQRLRERPRHARREHRRPCRPRDRLRRLPPVARRRRSARDRRPHRRPALLPRLRRRPIARRSARNTPAPCSKATATRPAATASTASSATWTPGTPPSTSSPTDRLYLAPEGSRADLVGAAATAR